MALTDKQRRFVDEYLIDLNATQAAIRAGYEFAAVPIRGYYTYLLIDPRDGAIFYVGKGKGERAFQHARNAERGHIDNASKFARIRDIQTSGAEVSVAVFSVHVNESDAFEAEKALIGAFKAYGLTNIMLGLATNETKAREFARNMLANLMPFDEWIRRASPTQLAFARALGEPRDVYEKIRSICHANAEGQAWAP